MQKKLRIVGVGNPLMGDDGVGVAVIRRLEALSLPSGVEAVDGGTGGVALLSLMEGWEKVWLIDALDMGAPPGTLRRLPVEAVSLPLAEEGVGPSLHQVDLGAVLALGRELGVLPSRLVLYGIQPQRVGRRSGLSGAVREALERLIEVLCREVGLGAD